MKRSLSILRVGFAAILFVAVLEIAARLDDYVAFGAPVMGVYSDANLYENDELGKHGKPFARYRKWQLNEFGYRGPGIEKDRIHIACFGASETFGLFESEDQEYPRQLEHELNARSGGTLYQVVNVAYPGLMIPTATQRVPQIVERVHPQIAIIYTTPTFYIDMPPKQLGRHMKAEPVPAFEWRINERLQNVVKSILPARVQTWLRAREIRRLLGSKKAMDRLPEETITRFREDYTELLSTLRANGVEPVVVTHATIFGPANIHPDRELLVSWRKNHPLLKEEGFLDAEQRINEVMRSVAGELHVGLIDIAREMPPEHAYFGDALHFTDAGAAVMAKQLADGLEPLLRSSAASQQSTRATAGAVAAHENGDTP